MNEIIHWLLKPVLDLDLTVTKNRQSVETPEVFTYQDVRGPCVVASQQNPASPVRSHTGQPGTMGTVSLAQPPQPQARGAANVAPCAL